MSKSRSQSLLSRLVPAAATNERTKRRQQVLALVLFVGIGAACVGGVSMTERSAKRREAPAKIADLTLHPERTQRERFVQAAESRFDAIEERLAKFEAEAKAARRAQSADFSELKSIVKGQQDSLAALSADAAETKRQAALASAKTGEEKRGTDAGESRRDPAALERAIAESYGERTAGASVESASRLAIASIGPAEDTRTLPSEGRPVKTPMLTRDDPIVANRASCRTVKEYLPAGSFAHGEVLHGVYASTGGAAASQPMPIVMKVEAPAQLPNRWRTAVQSCHVTGSATGDLSSERIHIRLDRLSCVSKKGETLDVRATGYAVGPDGKVGVRGTLITRSGQAIANALSLSILSGVGRAVSLSAQSTTTSTLTGTQTTDYENAWKSGIGHGISEGSDRLLDYYLKLADRIFPVLEIGAGTPVDIVFSQGILLADG